MLTMETKLKFRLSAVINGNMSSLLTPPGQCDAVWNVFFFFFISSIWRGKCLRFWSCSLFCDYATCWVFFLNLGINEISEDVYTAVERSDSEDSEKSDSSDSEYISDDEQKSKDEPGDAEDKEGGQVDKEPSALKKKPKPANPVEIKEEVKSMSSPASEKADPGSVKDKPSPQPEKDFSEKAKPSPHPTKDKPKGKDETDSPTVHLGLDSDSESELVIDLGEDHSGREGRKNKKEPKEPSPKQDGKWSYSYQFLDLVLNGTLRLYYQKLRDPLTSPEEAQQSFDWLDVT